MDVIGELKAAVEYAKEWLARHHGTRKFLYVVGYTAVSYVLANWASVIQVVPQEWMVVLAIPLAGLFALLDNWFKHLPKPDASAKAPGAKPQRTIPK